MKYYVYMTQRVDRPTYDRLKVGDNFFNGVVVEGFCDEDLDELVIVVRREGNSPWVFYNLSPDIKELPKRESDDG